MNIHVSAIVSPTFNATPKICSIATIQNRLETKKGTIQDLSSWLVKTTDGTYEVTDKLQQTMEVLKTVLLSGRTIYEFQHHLNEWTDKLSVAEQLAIEYLEVTGPFDLPPDVTIVDVSVIISLES
jgi:hypothetical protein